MGREIGICLSSEESLSFIFSGQAPLVPKQHPGNIMNYTHFVSETACTLILIEQVSGSITQGFPEVLAVG